ncbi:hypothetical protein BGZ46_000917 [Entomortierella lignicola]|nr:hypothetical protein BGZ46_000917 [Entomortierella lignicola]
MTQESEQLITQEIQSSSLTKTFETHWDKATGKRIVLWEDVKRDFHYATHVMDGTTSISFMVDDKFEQLKPQRFAYRPGVVLKVSESSPVQLMPANAAGQPMSTAVGQSMSIAAAGQPMSIAAAGQSTSIAAGQSTSPLHHVIYVESETRLPHSTFVGPQKTTEAANVSAGTSKTINLRNLPAETRPSFQAYIQLHESYCEAILAKQQHLADDIKVSMSKHFDELQIEMNKNQKLQEEVRKLAQQLKENQGEMMRMQHQALELLSLIHRRVEVVLIQTYELHEYPIPRLFIILPKLMRRHDRVTGLFTDQFQLYFLCECGKHTRAEGSTEVHEIHLAKHEGYEIDQPNEFFQKYGTYLMTMMEMFKYGFTAAEIVVPALTHFRFAEGLDSLQEILKSSGHTIQSLVDRSISFLKQGYNTGNYITRPKDDLGNLEVLEGADLRQLESYLRIKDEARVLGNLYRIVTHEGHVKWVCIDHYHKNYQESRMEDLKAVVKANGGIFNNERGEVTITLTSRESAKRFYKAISGKPGIQELKVALEWDLSFNDFQELSSAVSNANVSQLTIDKCNPDRSLPKIISRRHRFDPVLQLMSRQRLQILKIGNIKDFFRQVGDSSLLMGSQFRILSFDSNIRTDDMDSVRIISSVLKNCHSLVELHVVIRNPAPLMSIIMDGLGFRLETITKEVFRRFIRLNLHFSPHDNPSDNQEHNVTNTKSTGLTVKILFVGDYKADTNCMSTLYQEFGPYFKNLDVFQDRIAFVFDKATSNQDSKLTDITLDVTLFSSKGLDSMIQILDRSPNLESISLTFCFGDEVWMDNMEYILRHFGGKVVSMIVRDSSACSWLAEKFPCRQGFPLLDCLQLIYDTQFALQSIGGEWISRFLSISSQERAVPLPDEPLSTFPQENEARSTESTPEAYKPIKIFHLTNAVFGPECWKAVIEGLSFSVLKEVVFSSTNFSIDQMQILSNCVIPRIEDEEIFVSLKAFILTRTDAQEGPINSQAVREIKNLIDELQKKMPNTNFTYIPSVAFNSALLQPCWRN